MVFQSPDEYLDKEKDIYNHLGSAKRTYDVLLRLLQKQRGAFAQLKSFCEQLSTASQWHSSAKGFLSKKDLKKSIAERVEFIKTQVQRRMRILDQNLKSSSDEKEVIEQIQKHPLFQGVNDAEKKLIDELVFKEKEAVNQLIRVLKHLFLLAEKQLKKLDELNEKVSSSPNTVPNSNDTKEVEELVQYLETEGKELTRARELTKLLIKTSKQIIKDNKRLEKDFSSHDIEQATRILGDELKRAKDTYTAVGEVLQKLRHVRQKMSVHNLIAVHMTDYLPKNGILRPTSRFKIKHYGGTAGYPRGTIHLSLNGPVGSHMYGNWENKKIAILIPVPLIIDRIVNITSVDSFIFGEIKLPEGSEILIKEKDHKRDFSPGNAKVIVASENKKLQETVIERIKTKGYTPMTSGSWSWDGAVDSNDYKTIGKFFTTRNPSIGTDWSFIFKELARKVDIDIGAHTHTFWMKMENAYDGLLDALINPKYEERRSYPEFYEQIKKEIDESIEEFKKNTKRFVLREEKEEYDIIVKQFDKLKRYCDLKMSKMQPPQESKAA